MCEDGNAQKIAYFERDTDMPLSIVLAIDTSGSMRKDIPVEKAAARDFVHSMLRTGDQLDLMDFNSDVREVVPFTANMRRIDAGLDDLDFGPATALYNAIYLASQSLAPRHGRKVLVLISDGGNTKNGVDYSQALEAARRGESDDLQHHRLADFCRCGARYGWRARHDYTVAGDGRPILLRESGRSEAAFEKVSEDLRTQYLLGYYPDSKARSLEFRSISVTLTHPTQTDGPYTVQNRTGYYPDAAQ